MNRNRSPNFHSISSLLTAALAVGALACAAAALAQTGAVTIDLERMTPGAAPADFDFARTGSGAVGQWTVVADASAASGRAIEQGSTDATDYRFPLAIYKPATAANVEVTLRFKALTGKVDRAGGIAVRVSDADNYYVVRANALEDNVRFYRVVKGRREQLAGADLKVAANVWHMLGLRAQGDRFAVTFNGKELFTASDRTLSAAGRVALWTKADSVTRFDSIAIRPLP